MTLILREIILIHLQEMRTCLNIWITRLPCYFNGHLLLPTPRTFNAGEVEERDGQFVELPISVCDMLAIM
jgi:hypothetical protein